MASTYIDGVDDSDVIFRDEWEDPSLRVGSHVVNGRLYIAPRLPWEDYDGTAWHYPGVDVSVKRTREEKRAYLRAIQSDYARNRGYSGGYNDIIFRDGTVGVMRGIDYKNAANRDHNGHVKASKFVIAVGEQITLEQQHVARLITVADAKRAGRDVMSPWDVGGMWRSGHRDLPQYPPLFGKGTATACPGRPRELILDPASGLSEMGRGGWLHPFFLTPPEPPEPPKPAPQEIDMWQQVCTFDSEPGAFVVVHLGAESGKEVGGYKIHLASAQARDDKLKQIGQWDPDKPNNGIRNVTAAYRWAAWGPVIDPVPHSHDRLGFPWGHPGSPLT